MSDLEIELDIDTGAASDGPIELTPAQLEWLQSFLRMDLEPPDTGLTLSVDFSRTGDNSQTGDDRDLASPAETADAPPGDAPTGDAAQPKASCQITIKNSSHGRLTASLSSVSTTQGNLKTFPQTSLNPGDQTVFTFVSEAGPNEDKGCDARMSWTMEWPDGLTPPVQRNSAGGWSIGWVNAVGGQNSVSHQIFSNVPNNLTDFRDSCAAGAGDVDVPFLFEITGGPEAPVNPNPPKPVPVPPLPTTQEKDPTLRPGDHSGDGWVEYLQELLGLPQTGTYDPDTVKAVRQFQNDKHLQVDGVVGNQTWAALRHGQPEKVGTDGRKPHSFVDSGPKGRWEVKDELVLVLVDDGLLTVVSVGDKDLEGFKGTVIVKDPKGVTKEFAGVIGPKLNPGDKEEGSVHDFRIKGFLSGLGLAKGSDTKGFVVDAFLEQAIGGDHAQGGIAIA